MAPVTSLVACTCSCLQALCRREDPSFDHKLLANTDGIHFAIGTSLGLFACPKERSPLISYRPLTYSRSQKVGM